MRRILLLLTALMLSTALTTAEAAIPRCVMLKFIDETRYDRVNTAEILSEHVTAALNNSDKFIVNVPSNIDANLETMLCDEKVRGFDAMETAFETDDFDAVFEDMFDGRKAQSISTAQVGQIISPEITSEIGRVNGADYLIQGTIINLGVGNWLKDDYSAMSHAINMASTFNGMTASTSLIGFGGAGGSMTSIDIKKTGIGVQCDVRVIAASTGEVVWSKRVLGRATQKMIDLGIGRFGRDQLNDKLRQKAIELAADEIATALIEANDSGDVFVGE